MSAAGTAVIVGVGPGLGMSLARRAGREGHRVVLLSRNAARHDGYRRELGEYGIDVRTYAVDVTDRSRMAAVLTDIGADTVDVLYYGAGASALPTPITELDSATAREAFTGVWPAVDAVRAVLPGMRDRGRGSLLFAGGLSSVRPMPALGQLALAAAAVRNYALTLHEALAPEGLYAGTLTIGGAVERGDIHAMLSADPEHSAALAGRTLDPDALADTAWEMLCARDRAETVFDMLG